MSTRPPIPQGAPPPYINMVTRVYKKSLRPVVLFAACLSALWTLVWGVSNFRDISSDNRNSLGVYVPFDIVLGALFCAATVIEVFGIVAASMQRIFLVRLYSFGTIVAALLVVAAQIINIVLDFKYKSKLVDRCFNINQDFFVNEADAKSYCNNAVDRDIIADFIWLIVTSILAALFTSVVFAYYRQMLDPNFGRAPSNQFRMQAFQPPPGVPYGAAYAPGAQYGGPYSGQPEYVPPYDPTKLPQYDGTGRQTPEKEQQEKSMLDEAKAYNASMGHTSNPFERRAEEP